MARVLMIGYGPLPRPGLTLFMAPSLRTRHLLHGVIAGGHQVDLFTLPLPGTEGEEGKEWLVIPDEYEGLRYHRFSNHSGEFAINQLTERLPDLQPDAIIGVNTYPSYIAAMLPTVVPMWADLNGYWMAEIQAKCAAEKDDRRLVGAWAIERAILRRLDKFSAVSRPQLHAVLGEMATVGRLNSLTFNYPFGVHLPNAAHRWESAPPDPAEDQTTNTTNSTGTEEHSETPEVVVIETPEAASSAGTKPTGSTAAAETSVESLPENQASPDKDAAAVAEAGPPTAEATQPDTRILIEEKPAGELPADEEKSAETAAPHSEPTSAAHLLLRGIVVPTDAFIVLWSGGFNLWTDIDMLVDAMDELMKRNPQVHLITTGGPLHGVDTTTYQHFLDRVAQSPFKDRYHPLGWVESEKIPLIYREADIGLNVDGANYETMFGARNRINAMAAEGLAIASTVGTEISEWLEDAEAVLGFQMGDPESLVEAIEPWIDQREHLELIARRALRVMEDDFSYEKTTERLRAWLRDPKLAPDNEAKIRRSGGELDDLNAVTGNPLEAHSVLLDQYDSRSLLDSVREIETLRNRRWYQVYKKVRKTVRE